MGAVFFAKEQATKVCQPRGSHLDPLSLINRGTNGTVYSSPLGGHDPHGNLSDVHRLFLNQFTT